MVIPSSITVLSIHTNYLAFYWPILQNEIKVLVDNGELTNIALNPKSMWKIQKRMTYQKLILAIVEKLPQYKQNCQNIEKILKQHHKTQRRMMKINSDQELKDYNWSWIARNTKINKVNISIPISF